MTRKKLDKLLRMLRDPDHTRRRTAAQDLAGGDERVIYPLLQALRDENPGVQDAAMTSLIGIGGEVVAYMVIPLLREDSYLRNTAQLMLKGLGPVCVPLLYPLLLDKDDDVRKFALDLLGEIKIGVRPDKVVPLVRDGNANVRAAAIKTLGELEYSGAAMYIIEALKDEEWVCFSALDTLGELRDENAVAPIADLLRSESQTIRLAAIETLGMIGSRKAVAPLNAHVERTGGEERTLAIKSLAMIGLEPGMSGVAEDLKRMFRDSVWQDKLIALKGLKDLKDASAIPLIIDVAGVLDESVPGEDELLMRIRSALREFGPSEVFIDVLEEPETKFKGRIIAAEMCGLTGVARSVPVLTNLLREDHRDVRRACALSLGMIGTDDALRPLLTFIDDEESHVRKTAISALGRPGNDEAFEPILARLEHEDYEDIMDQAVRSLIAIDSRRLLSMMDRFNEPVREAVGRFSTDLDTLLMLSRDESVSVAMSALSSLGRIDNTQAAERVIEAVTDENPEIRRVAVLALGSMEVGHEYIKPLLKDNDMWVRLHAVRTLGQGLRQDMVEMLNPMLNDSEIPVVLAAVESIAMIGGKDAFAALSALADHPNAEVAGAVREALERF